MVTEAVNLIQLLEMHVNDGVLGTALLIKKANQTKSWRIDQYKP